MIVGWLFRYKMRVMKLIKFFEMIFVNIVGYYYWWGFKVFF